MRGVEAQFVSETQATAKSGPGKAGYKSTEREYDHHHARLTSMFVRPPRHVHRERHSKLLVLRRH